MEVRYEAFISYRHKPLDAALAKALHRQIETFRVPGRIAGQSGKKRMGKVFRDQDELPLMADLGDGIRGALERSDWLVCVCTPDLLQSKWCMAEVDYFIKLGRRDNILCLLADGEPEDSFPPQLRFVEMDGGQTEEREPLAADVRAPGLYGALRRLRVEKLRLLAPILKVDFDDLRRRARERFLRRALAVCISAAVFFAVFGGYAWFQSVTITRQNDELLAQRSRIYARFADEELAQGNRAGAGLLLFETMPDGLPVSQEAADALYRAAYGQAGGDDLHFLMRVSGGDAVPSPDGRTFTVSDDDATRLYDAQTLRLLYENPGALTDVTAFENGGVAGATLKRPVYNKAGDKVFLPNGAPVLLDAHTGATLREGGFTDAAELADYGLSRYHCVDSQSTRRCVVDLSTGERIFDAPTENATAKTLFSPDDRYFIVATANGLAVFDVEKREAVTVLPGGDGMVEQGYTLFTPDSRFLILTRYRYEPYTDFETEKNAKIYSLQVLEIPSCRVVYESTLAETALYNYYHAYESDLAMYLCAPDGSKIVLPVDPHGFGVFDLNREEMLFERAFTFEQIPYSYFITFAPGGDRLSTVSSSGRRLLVYDAETGETALEYDLGAAAAYPRSFLLPGGEKALLSGAVTIAGAGAAVLAEIGAGRDEEATPDMFFRDGGGRYIRPDSDGEGASILDARNPAAAPVPLEDSAQYTKSFLLCGDGEIVVGLNGEHVFGAVPVAWDAATGKRLRGFTPDGEVSQQYAIGGQTGRQTASPFLLSRDGERLAVVHYTAGVAAGGFTVFDTATGKPAAEWYLGPLSDYVLLFDKDVTKALYIFNNELQIIDAAGGGEVITLDDYPAGETAIATWSGHRAAISDDGGLAAVSHSKKGTLEIIDTETGERLHEIPLGSTAVTDPCFSHDGGRVTICTENDLFSVDTKTGALLFAVYDDAGFGRDYTWSDDDRFLMGDDIRDADTGERACSILPPSRPVWEIAETAGTLIPAGAGCAVYLPTAGEAAARLREHIREYEFTRADKLRYAME
ncbi:MAG: TIR domain-containing protein [Gracilibacteraceae bacterium]|jgi:WD40 repeat protein|nr:TIR domain-containing protein [Gracilibacteraceae bacterium]